MRWIWDKEITFSFRRSCFGSPLKWGVVEIRQVELDKLRQPTKSNSSTFFINKTWLFYWMSSLLMFCELLSLSSSLKLQMFWFVFWKDLNDFQEYFNLLQHFIKRLIIWYILKYERTFCPTTFSKFFLLHFWLTLSKSKSFKLFVIFSFILSFFLSFIEFDCNLFSLMMVYQHCIEEPSSHRDGRIFFNFLFLFSFFKGGNLKRIFHSVPFQSNISAAMNGKCFAQLEIKVEYNCKYKKRSIIFFEENNSGFMVSQTIFNI